ncbi:hypothetical protein OH540_09610 [Streptomyces sp. BPPL-273]|uniref:hypothetical protein n=1 Tax=Streptomyces sp. BPPL-273 TaxID=2987533 RepID=UPI0024AFB053|nr:hypothetical protein [Streptomyces sp. BPPL-273]WHM30279.1 hypothetical protein OH540_09610 [Streptomyces sp. BPPL-273]
MNEAIETVEAVIWGAVISFGILAALTAYIVTALGYWTAVFAVWAGRGLAGYIRYRRSLPARRAALAAERQHTAQQWQQRARKTAPRITTRPGTNQDALDTCNGIWNASTREETP